MDSQNRLRPLAPVSDDASRVAGLDNQSANSEALNGKGIIAMRRLPGGGTPPAAEPSQHGDRYLGIMSGIFARGAKLPFVREGHKVGHAPDLRVTSKKSGQPLGCPVSELNRINARLVSSVLEFCV